MKVLGAFLTIVFSQDEIPAAPEVLEWTKYAEMADYFKSNTEYEDVYYDSVFVNTFDLTAANLGYRETSTIYKSYTGRTSYIQIYYEGMVDEDLHIAW